MIHVEDANGVPYVGAKLYVCTAGTTTLASIYSDASLTTPLTNPLTSDSAGNFSFAYIAAGTYKLRAERSDSTGIGTGTLIWQYDNIDTGLGSGSGALAIASGGTAATTAAAARTNLGAAAQTDVDDLAADIATLNQSLQNIVSVPQGYLTLTSGTPFITGDVAAATAVYYTPLTGNLVPIWNGTQHIVYDFAELTLTLNANHTAGNLYDVFITLDSGSPIIVTGPAWNTATAGAGARGTGAGTTELERKNGLWTNKVAMTARNGATTYSVEANKATYVGTIAIDGTNGQVTCHMTWGSSRKWGVWNAYNRADIYLFGGDSTSGWSYSTATIRQSRGQTTNRLTTLCGLAEEKIYAKFNQYLAITTANGSTGTATARMGIGVNSTTAFATNCKVGKYNYVLPDNGGTADPAIAVEFEAEHMIAPALGLQEINSLEITDAVSNATVEFFGSSANMRLAARWRG
jgi:hypothetical protein